MWLPELLFLAHTFHWTWKIQSFPDPLMSFVATTYLSVRELIIVSYISDHSSLDPISLFLLQNVSCINMSNQNINCLSFIEILFFVLCKALAINKKMFIPHAHGYAKMKNHSPLNILQSSGKTTIIVQKDNCLNGPMYKVLWEHEEAKSQ